MAENQEQGKPNEREIPVFTVLKNNCILKNIFLLDNPPSISPDSNSVAENVDRQSEMEEILLVGRHPDCSIKLEHPSISRFHLRIHSKPSSRSLFVTDLSSAHGTWISGKRIEPGVRMKLNEGDTLHLGASSRLYRLNWVPLSYAYDFDNPFVPQLGAVDTVDEETDGAVDQVGGTLSYSNDQEQILGDNMKGLDVLFADEDLGLSMQKYSPTSPLMSELHDSLSNEEDVENSSSPRLHNQEKELSSNQLFPSEKENRSPQARFPSAESQRVYELVTTETSQMNSEKRSVLSIWSRRGKTESVQIETGRSRRNSARIDMDLQIESLGYEEYKCESILKDHYTSSDDNEETFKPGKENTSPSSLLVRSLKSKGEETLKNKSISETSFCSVDQDEEEVFTSDKENMTPNSHLLRSGKVGKLEKGKHPKLLFPDNDEEIFTPDKENTTPKSHLLRSVKVGKLENVKHQKLLFADNNEEIFTSDKENTSPGSLLVRSLKSKGEETLKNKSISYTPISCGDQTEEVFTPDKENMTPKIHLLRPTKSTKIRKLEVKQPKLYRSSPLKTADRHKIYPDETMSPTSGKKSQHRNVLQTCDSTGSAPKSCGSLKKQPAVLNARADRDPFRPLPMNSSSNHRTNPEPSVHEVTMRGSKSINCSKSGKINHSHHNNMKVEKKKWIIVVDTCCLLNKKSRRELQLLRGLKGTSLVIPRIVVRELDCLLRRGSIFTRKTGVSAALQWIEDCMAAAQWWVHIQSTAEEARLVPPTPPSTPHWFGEGKGASSLSSNPFSPYSLQEIVTPTAADHILEYALFVKRTRNDGQVVLLSDDLTLKIKAMAEGVICETAEEFRGSLVNPFSERFLYSDSSPVGPTWSCVDDAVLKERYYPSPSKKLSKSGEVAKGLKLILMHNSSFRQIKPVS